MNKLAITTMALTFVIAGVATATTTTSGTTAVNGTAQNQQQAANLASSEPAAGKKHKHWHHHHMAPVTQAETTPYTEMHVGDPRIVYHEIGTDGAQRGNTIVPFYDEPVRSVRPYEIRYDYAEFRDEAGR